MYWNAEMLNAVFNIDDELILELTDEDLEEVESNWKGRPGMHSEEGRKLIGEAVRKRNSQTYRLEFKDGTIKVVHNLEEYCRQRNISSGTLSKVGKIDHKGYMVKSRYGIVKVEKLNKS